MLKKFFMSFLGSMAAIWLSAMILFVLTIVFIAGLIGSSLKSVEIVDHSILHIRLDGTISEHEAPQDIPDLIINGQSSATTFEDILRSLEYAADDSRIEGVYIDCAGSALGYASRAELREALSRFKKDSGKWVLAYGDDFSQGDYYVASVADTVYLNPVGTLDIHGLSSSVPYFKDALDKLDVNIQVFKVGTYKSAVEPFMLNSMSEPARMQTQLFLDSIWASISEGIGMSRKIPAAGVCALADSLTMSRSAQWCLTHKLIDKSAYRRQIEDVLCALTETDDPEDLELVSPAEYMSDYAGATSAMSDDTHIAVVFADGDITEDGNEGIVASSLVPEILRLAKTITSSEWCCASIRVAAVHLPVSKYGMQFIIQGTGQARVCFDGRLCSLRRILYLLRRRPHIRNAANPHRIHRHIRNRSVHRGNIGQASRHTLLQCQHKPGRH